MEEEDEAGAVVEVGLDVADLGVVLVRGFGWVGLGVGWEGGGCGWQLIDSVSSRTLGLGAEYPLPPKQAKQRQ